LLAVDHEGGRVLSFIKEFTRIPPMRKFGELYEQDAKLTKQLVRDTAWLMAAELRSVSIDFSFAPIADLDRKKCSVIGDRSFHSKPNIVYELDFAFTQGFEQAGMASVAKHFPGHGAVTEDSHTEIPIDKREFDSIYEKDIYPFRMLIQNNLTAIMPAHVIYSKVDALPAGFSPFWLQKILRQRLNFNGVIFSDDLNMHGASVAGENYSDRAHAALTAGCDMVLICNNRAAAIQIVEGLSGYSDPVSATRLARMHGRKPISHSKLVLDNRWHQTKKQLAETFYNPNMELDI
jgi:beta-N-acetylhexosaminidase